MRKKGNVNKFWSVSQSLKELILTDKAQMESLNMGEQPNNPLHGKTLEIILTELVEYYGWERLGYQVNIRCFNENPSINSSLKFLRKTPWARQKVEELYITLQHRRK